MNEEIEKGKYEGSSRSDTIIYRSIVGGMLGLAVLGAWKGIRAYNDFVNTDTIENYNRMIGNFVKDIGEVTEEYKKRKSLDGKIKGSN